MAERTSRLTRANTELSQANRDLQTARHALARTERLAALGTLVAGISHEVNTPLGNAISMCTALQARFMQLADHLQQETLKRGALLDFLRGGADGADIMLRNVQRVVNLISALRDLVGNSRGFARREFRLVELLHTCSAQYQERLAAHGGALQLAVPADIMMEGYPLALAEVVEQLLDNALEHGLRDHPGGNVRLTASVQGDSVTLSISDSGRGMVPDVREAHLRSLLYHSPGTGHVRAGHVHRVQPGPASSGRQCLGRQPAGSWLHRDPGTAAAGAADLG